MRRYECRDCGNRYDDTIGDHCPECGGADVISIGHGYPYTCPWCEYELRKERYFGPHVFEEHPEKVANDE